MFPLSVLPTGEIVENGLFIRKGMRYLENNENICTGFIKISENVLIEIAENAVNEIEGITIPDKKYNISIEIKGGVAEVTVPVIIEYGFRTAQCTELVQSSIKKSIQDMTGVAVSKVNVLVKRLSEKKYGEC